MKIAKSASSFVPFLDFLFRKYINELIEMFVLYSDLIRSGHNFGAGDVMGVAANAMASLGGWAAMGNQILLRVIR